MPPPKTKWTRIKESGQKHPIFWKALWGVAGFTLAHIQDSGAELLWGAFARWGALKALFQMAGIVLLLLLFWDQYKIAKRKDATELLWVLWLIVAASVTISITRSYKPTREVANRIKIATIAAIAKWTASDAWITKEQREWFLSSGSLPPPPTPIIIALSSHSKETREGGEAIRDLLIAVYGPNNVQPGFRYDITIDPNPQYPSHKYIVYYSPDAKTNAAWIAATELMKRLAPKIDSAGGRNRGLKSNEMCVYVQDLRPPK
jgi:hypothetical protein